MIRHGRQWLWFMCAAVLIYAITVHVAAAHAEELPEQLSATLERYASLGGFSCEFSQSLEFHDGLTQTYEGDLAVLPPKRFRWRYHLPYEQEFIGDGKRLWHYEPDLMQVRVLYDLEMVDPVVMRLLAGRVAVSDIRLIEADVDSERYHIRIGDDGADVWLGLADDGLIAYVETIDILSNRNRMHFNHWQFSPPAEALFVFKLPDGVDVVEE
ncbi:MAG: outer-membrane lipoprotein carrier protein LolA [Mariprofundaceae bacterium]